MKIGLCMSVVGAGGGNDAVLQSLYSYLTIEGHTVTVFTNTKPLRDLDIKVKVHLNVRLPLFGIFQQLMPISHKEMHEQDLLIFLTGQPPKGSKVKTVYYHQQMPHQMAAIPEKYKHGKWKAYYSLFRLVAKLIKPNNNSVIHYCVSDYLKHELQKVGINAIRVYPAIERIAPTIQKQGCIVTVCRISPEKRLEDNLDALADFRYEIYGSVTTTTRAYFEDLTHHLHEQQTIHENAPRAAILSALGRATVYYSSSKETLGLAVLEAIAAGCIPVVIDNSANRETVPFRELRFIDAEHGKHLVDKALYGGFDYLKPELQKHLQKFSGKNYNELVG